MDISLLLSYYDQCGIRLYVKNGELGYRASKGAMTQDMLLEIRARKNEILRYLTRRDELRFRMTSTDATRAPLFNRFLWKDYSNRIMEISTANVPHIVTRYTGEILTAPLRRSIDILLERHDILSSSIEMADGNLYLIQHPQKTVAFQEITVAGETIQQKEAESQRITNDLVWKEYDLDNGPLYRVFLVRLSAVEYILGVGLHHAIGDLISIGILYQELLSIYGSVVGCIPLRVPPPRLRYMDYLASMESWSHGSGCEEHIQYWKDTLKTTPTTDLLSIGERQTAGTVSESTAEVKLLLDSETSRNLKEMAIQLKTTLFTMLLAIYKIALWRMTGQEDLVVVALHAGRLDAGFQNALGDFALEVAYKTSLVGKPDFTEVVRRVTQAMNEANSHQPVPLDWVRRALAQEGIAFSAPGINFISGDTQQVENPTAPRQLSFPPPGVRHGCHGFPASFAIEFRDGNGIIEGSLVYRNDLYNEATISRFMDCFIQTAVDAIRKFPE
jgi:hypothetical protein